MNTTPGHIPQANLIQGEMRDLLGGLLPGLDQMLIAAAVRFRDPEPRPTRPRPPRKPAA